MHTDWVSPLPPKKSKEPQNTTESVYGPKRLWARLGELAAADNRSKSDLIVGILEQWLEKHEEESQRPRQ